MADCLHGIAPAQTNPHRRVDAPKISKTLLDPGIAILASAHADERARDLVGSGLLIRYAGSAADRGAQRIFAAYPAGTFGQ